LATPEQVEHWSDLLPLLTWQLWQVSTLVNDVRLPWQKPQPAGHKTPGRVRRCRNPADRWLKVSQMVVVNLLWLSDRGFDVGGQLWYGAVVTDRRQEVPHVWHVLSAAHRQAVESGRY
jgi:hypothetical protein